MSLYSLELKLAGRKCVVVGGGRVAERKVAALRECDAQVTVVAPKLTQALSRLAAAGQVTHLARPFTAADLDDAVLCIAATDDQAANELAYRESVARNLPVNVVDQPELCTFFVPATVKRGPVSVALSTSGNSPALARELRKQLEQVVTPAHGQLAELLGRLRDEVKARYPTQAARAEIFGRMLKSDALELLQAGRADEAEAVLRACLS